jgi:transmembrane sensor
MFRGVPTDSAILDEAAQWVLRLENEVGDAVREEFHRWVAEPEHEQAYLAMLSLTVAAGELPAQERADLLASVSASAPSLRGVPVPAPALRAPRPKWHMVTAIAASAIFASVVAIFVFSSPSHLMAESFQTDTGEMRTVPFEDGSVAYLNTRTRLKWLGGINERRVALLEGEALFDVRHDESRPFHVELENSEIQVRGTRFNVYRKKSEEVVVTVLEGTVDVQELGQGRERPAWKRELHAGERLVYRPIGLIQDVHRTDALDAVKWRDGVLQLENEPLRDVLDELTRYTNLRIVIRDPRIAEIPIGGALSTRDVRLSLRRLQALEPTIIVSEQGGQFELSLRPGTQQPARQTEF